MDVTGVADTEKDQWLERQTDRQTDRQTWRDKETGKDKDRESGGRERERDEGRDGEKKEIKRAKEREIGRGEREAPKLESRLYVVWHCFPPLALSCKHRWLVESVPRSFAFFG